MLCANIWHLLRLKDKLWLIHSFWLLEHISEEWNDKVWWYLCMDHLQLDFEWIGNGIFLPSHSSGCELIAWFILVLNFIHHFSNILAYQTNIYIQTVNSDEHNPESVSRLFVFILSFSRVRAFSQTARQSISFVNLKWFIHLRTRTVRVFVPNRFIVDSCVVISRVTYCWWLIYLISISLSGFDWILRANGPFPNDNLNVFSCSQTFGFMDSHRLCQGHWDSYVKQHNVVNQSFCVMSTTTIAPLANSRNFACSRCHFDLFRFETG